MSAERDYKTRDQTYSQAYLVPNPLTPNQAIVIDEQLCTGCSKCVDVCRSDVMVKSPQKGEPPVVLYPDECWFCHGGDKGGIPLASAGRLETQGDRRVLSYRHEGSPAAEHTAAGRLGPKEAWS
jgi:ferredoxin